jgi:hypothetical protein
MPDFQLRNPLEKPNGVADSDEEIVRLETEIAMKRERVAASLGELRRRVDRATNWRGWIGSHPIAWVAVGLSLGFLVGQLGRRDRLHRH